MDRAGQAAYTGVWSVVGGAAGGAVWLAFLVAGVLLGLALASYDPADAGFTHTVLPGHVARNLCGTAGAWCADALLWLAGWSAWWVVAAFALVGLRYLLRVWFATEKKGCRGYVAPVIGFALLMSASPALEALQLGYLGGSLPLGAGGVIGRWIASQAVPYAGVWGSTALLVIALAAALRLVFGFPWLAIAEVLGLAVETAAMWTLVRPAQALRRLAARRRAGGARSGAPGALPAPPAGEVLDGDARDAAPYAGPGERDEDLPEEPSGDWPGGRREPVLGDGAEVDDGPFAEPVLFGGEAAEPQDRGPAEPGLPGLPPVARSGMQRGARRAPAAAPAPAPEPERLLPAPGLLNEPPADRPAPNEEKVEALSRMIEHKLKTFRVDAKVVGHQIGPVITQFWLEPGPGVKSAQIERLNRDLSRALSVSAVRIVESLPGKPYMGIEIPNNRDERQGVLISEVLASKAYRETQAGLPLALGKDIAGLTVTVDLAKLPHLLVGGTTGSGKSVGINTMILSLLYKRTPEELRLVLIDPKTVEFASYQDIPHLLTPVVTDMSKAACALGWLVKEMDRRYRVMSKLGVRSFDRFNEVVKAAAGRGEPIMDPYDVTPENPEPHVPLKPWPYIVCFIDELADLILVNRKQVEMLIMRLAQKARAAGMHLVLATQRPSVDVVTPLIKANVAARICFAVAGRYDSQTVLEESGAQDLLGRGDMLLRDPTMYRINR
ncbi:MAG: DNA translocase FtsK 4TM domain-containing protein, partial [Duodenibacillus sp.]|nr:DNA translocase FtsK 4TM domain-containing protein [Duodenibacillus sp.]